MMLVWGSTDRSNVVEEGFEGRRGGTARGGLGRAADALALAQLSRILHIKEASFAARAEPEDAGALGWSEGGCRAKSCGESAGVASRARRVSGEPPRPGDDSRSQGHCVLANGTPGSRGGALAPRDRETRRFPRRPLLAPTRSRPPPHRIGGRRSLVEWDEEPGRAPRSGRWFEGWARNAAPPVDRPAVARAQTWLLRAGWRRHGLIRSDEVPGGERSSTLGRASQGRFLPA